MQKGTKYTRNVIILVKYGQKNNPDAPQYPEIMGLSR